MSVGAPTVLDTWVAGASSPGVTDPVSSDPVSSTAGRPLILFVSGRFDSGPGSDLIEVSAPGVTWTHIGRHLQATTRYATAFIGVGTLDNDAVTIQAPDGNGFRRAFAVLIEVPDGGDVRAVNILAGGAFTQDFELGPFAEAIESGSGLFAVFDKDGTDSSVPSPRTGWTQEVDLGDNPGGQAGRTSFQYRLSNDTHAGSAWSLESDHHTSGVAFELEAAEAGLTPAVISLVERRANETELSIDSYDASAAGHDMFRTEGEHPEQDPIESGWDLVGEGIDPDVNFIDETADGGTAYTWKLGSRVPGSVGGYVFV